MDVFPIDAARQALKGCGKLNKEDLRQKLLSFEGAPDVIVFTHTSRFPAWVVRGNEMSVQRITPDIQAKLSAFWAAAKTLTGTEMPVAEASVQQAADILGIPAPRIVPCTTAFPEDMFAAALTRTAQLLKKDFPLIETQDSTVQFVAFWDLNADSVRVMLKPARTA